MVHSTRLDFDLHTSSPYMRQLSLYIWYREGLYGSMLSTPAWRTKCDHILVSLAVHQWRWWIISIAVIGGTCIFEYLGVHTWLAFFWSSVLISATKWVLVKCQTGTFASHHFPFAVQNLKLFRTPCFQVSQAPTNTTIRCYRPWQDWNRKIVSINHAHIIVIWQAFVSLKRNLHQCHWWSAYQSIASQSSITVSSFTSRAPIRGKVASCSAPNPTVPWPRCSNALSLASREGEAAVSYHRLSIVGSSCRPYGKGTLVVNVKRNCVRYSVSCNSVLSYSKVQEHFNIGKLWNLIQWWQSILFITKEHATPC